MRVIHKEPIAVNTKLPYDAVALSVQLQHGEMMIWYHTNPQREPSTVVRRVYVVGTGHTLPDDAAEPHGQFVGTVQAQSFVWHIFLGYPST